jgi:hypothetical protein
MHVAGDERRAGMAHTANLAFSHRRNDNDTIDSICLKCFRTIATKGTKAELADSEADHECGGFDLAFKLYPEDQKPPSR